MTNTDETQPKIVIDLEAAEAALEALKQERDRQLFEMFQKRNHHTYQKLADIFKLSTATAARRIVTRISKAKKEKQ